MPLTLINQISNTYLLSVLLQMDGSVPSRTNFFILTVSVAIIVILTIYLILIYRKLRVKNQDISSLKDIIEEKASAEKALRQSEENYQKLIKTLNEGLIALDKNFKIEFINSKAAKILGVSDKTSLIGETLNRFLLTSEDQQLFKDKMELQKMGIADHYELKMKTLGGDVLWTSLSSAPILDENMNAKGCVTLIADVTDKKKSEESYNELTSNLNQKIKQINCLYDISDISGVPGISFEEIIKKSIEIIPVGLKYTHDIGVQIVFDNKVYSSDNYKETPWSYVVPIKVQKKKLGHLKVVYLEEKPRINKDPFHFNEKILLKNISEKFGQIIQSKKMEKILRENQEKLQDIQKIARIGYWEKEFAKERIFFSETFFDIADIEYEKRRFFDFEKFTEIIHPEDKEQFLNKVNADLKTAEADIVNFNYRIITKKGHIKYIYSTRKILLEESGDIQSVVFIMQDITNQKISQELRYNAEVALKTSEAKQHVLANMSYEMRTPINGIMGMVDFLLKSKLTREQQELSKTIKESSEGLLSIINNILDLSMTETGELHLNSQHFSFSELLQKMNSLFYALTKHKELNLQLKHDDNIPDIISTDKERLFQVITNLMSNAVESSETGIVKVSTKLLESRDKKLKILFKIIDNNQYNNDHEINIGQDNYDGKEYELLEETGKISNMDSSIAISKKLVELLGGKIDFRIRKNGYGNICQFTFNATKVDDKEKNENSDESKYGFNLENLAGINVLYVEDKTVNQKVVSLMLKHVNCGVDIAENGRKALEMVSENHYHVILLDMVMPVMDGLETMKIMNQKYKNHPPVIALSANVLGPDKEKYFSYGVVDFISKPVNANDLYSKLLKTTRTKIEKNAESVNRE